MNIVLIKNYTVRLTNCISVSLYPVWDFVQMEFIYLALCQPIASPSTHKNCLA